MSIEIDDSEIDDACQRDIISSVKGSSSSTPVSMVDLETLADEGWLNDNIINWFGGQINVEINSSLLKTVYE